MTWESSNHRDRNQIDHIAINGRYRRSLLDTRAMKGADVGSDHHLVMATTVMTEATWVKSAWSWEEVGVRYTKQDLKVQR